MINCLIHTHSAYPLKRGSVTKQLIDSGLRLADLGHLLDCLQMLVQTRLQLPKVLLELSKSQAVPQSGAVMRPEEIERALRLFQLNE